MDSLKEFQILSYFELEIKPGEDLPCIPDVPTGRSGHSMCADESNLYVFGGYSQPDEDYHLAEHSVFTEVWRFNFAQQEWTKINVKNTQAACLSSCMLLQEGKLFVFGGTGYPFASEKDFSLKYLSLPTCSFNSKAKGDMADTDKTEYKWMIVNTKQPELENQDNERVVPPADYGQSMILHRRSLYIFAGTVGFYSLEAIAKLYRLDLDTFTWEVMNPTGTKPCGRYKQEVVQDSEYLYVLGGGRLHRSEGLDTIFRYSFSQNHWTTVTSLPDPKHGFPKSRLSFGCSKEKDNVYISGGRHHDQTENNYPCSLGDIWHLRLSTLQWTRLQFDMPENVFFLRTVIAPSGYMYMFGGVLEDGFRSDKLYRFRLPFTLGKLTELCWDKVCGLLKYNNSFSYNELVTLGVPWNLIERAAPGSLVSNQVRSTFFYDV